MCNFSKKRSWLIQLRLIAPGCDFVCSSSCSHVEELIFCPESGSLSRIFAYFSAGFRQCCFRSKLGSISYYTLSLTEKSLRVGKTNIQVTPFQNLRSDEFQRGELLLHLLSLVDSSEQKYRAVN